MIPRSAARFIARAKIYLGRAIGYSGIINFFMTTFVFITMLQTRYNYKMPEWMLWATYAVMLVIVFAIGYVDDKGHILEEELKFGTDRTPQIM
jgi:hypothetical protein